MSQPSPKDLSFKGSSPGHPFRHSLILTLEYQACTALSLAWAQSYDTKDWNLLSTIVTPELYIDYRSVMGPTHIWPSMSAAAYVAMMSSPSALGNPLVATQHILGLSSFERTAEDEITGTLQARAHHLRFASDGCGDANGFGKGTGRKVLASATGHAMLKHFYKRTREGTWKLAGLQPTVLFDDGDLKALLALKEEVSAGAVQP
jgi:scytalone dehydratase